MTDEILAAANKLADAIKNSELYGDYRSCLAKLRKNLPLETRVRFFKNAQAELETKIAPGQGISFDDEKAMSNKYRELVSDPDAAAFLACEEKFLRTYTEVLAVIDGACDIEIF